jgi:hypothetical protein
MRKLGRIAPVAFALAAGACVKVIGPHPDLVSYHFENNRSGTFIIGELKGDDGRPIPGRWQVTFEGTSDTTDDTAQTYFLYRSATLALEHGYDGLQLLSNVRLSVEPNEYVEPRHFGDPPRAFPVYSSDIQFLKKPFVVQPPKILDATAVKAELEPYAAGKKCDHDNVCPHDHLYLRSD